MLLTESCSKKIPAYVSNILQSTRITYIGNDTQIHITFLTDSLNVIGIYREEKHVKWVLPRIVQLRIP